MSAASAGRRTRFRGSSSVRGRVRRIPRGRLRRRRHRVRGGVGLGRLGAAGDRVPRAAEAVDPLAVDVTLAAVAGVAIERLATERDLELRLAALEERELAADAG